MIPFVLPNVLLIAENCTDKEYVDLILPEMKKIFPVQEPVQVCKHRLQHDSHYIETSPSKHLLSTNTSLQLTTPFNRRPNSTGPSLQQTPPPIRHFPSTDNSLKWTFPFKRELPSDANTYLADIGYLMSAILRFLCNLFLLS